MAAITNLGKPDLYMQASIEAPAAPTLGLCNMGALGMKALANDWSEPPRAFQATAVREGGKNTQRQE
eukprot:6486687-Amphidinium_carterae.2